MFVVKFDVCVFQVTALSVLVRSAPPEPAATHTPLPYATERMFDVVLLARVIQENIDLASFVMFTLAEIYFVFKMSFFSESVFFVSG
jgi:hypothetical protein